MGGVETCGSAALTSALTECQPFLAPPPARRGRRSLPFALIVHDNPAVIYFGHAAASCALALLHRVCSGHSPQRGRLFKHSEWPSASISAWY